MLPRPLPPHGNQCISVTSTDDGIQFLTQDYEPVDRGLPAITDPIEGELALTRNVIPATPEPIRRPPCYWQGHFGKSTVRQSFAYPELCES